MVFKCRLGKLRLQRAPERRSAVMRQSFQVDTVRQFAHQRGFTAAGTAADQNHRTRHQLFRHLNHRLTQCFVTAGDQRVFRSRIPQPLLHDM